MRHVNLPEPGASKNFAEPKQLQRNHLNENYSSLPEGRIAANRKLNVPPLRGTWYEGQALGCFQDQMQRNRPAVPTAQRVVTGCKDRNLNRPIGMKDANLYCAFL